MESCDHQSGETQNGGGREYTQLSENALQQLLFEIMKKKDWMVSLGTLDVFMASPIETRNGKNMKIELWRENGYPKPILMGLMRNIARLVRSFELHGITDWDLRPCCLTITYQKDCPLDPEKMRCLYAVLSEKCYKKRHESLDSPPPDMAVAVGRLLFFCMIGVSKTDSRATKCLKTSSSETAAEQATKSHLDFTALKNIPEAVDLIQALLNTPSDKRYLLGESVDDIMCHPLFWDDHHKLTFLGEASCFVNTKGGSILESSVRVASNALCGSIDQDDGVDKVKKILKDLEEEAYAYYYKRKVLRDYKYKREVGIFCMSSYPQLYFELYKVVREHDLGFISNFCHKQHLD